MWMHRAPTKSKLSLTEVRVACNVIPPKAKFCLQYSQLNTDPTPYTASNLEYLKTFEHIRLV